MPLLLVEFVHRVRHQGSSFPNAGTSENGSSFRVARLARCWATSVGIPSVRFHLQSCPGLDPAAPPANAEILRASAPSPWPVPIRWARARAAISRSRCACSIRRACRRNCRGLQSHFPQAVEDRAANAKLRVGFQLHVLRGIEFLDGVDQPQHTGVDQIVERNLRRQTVMDSPRDIANLRQMFQEQPFARGRISRTRVRRRIVRPRT